MRNGHLDILAGKVNRLVKRLFRHVLIQQVEQSVFRRITLSVELDREAQVEVSIILDKGLDIFQVVAVLAEYLFIDHKTD